MKATGNAVVFYYLPTEWHFPDIFYRQDKYLYVSPLENFRNSWLEYYRKAYEKYHDTHVLFTPFHRDVSHSNVILVLLIR